MSNNYREAIDAVVKNSSKKGPYSANWKGLIDAINDANLGGGGSADPGGGSGGGDGSSSAPSGIDEVLAVNNVAAPNQTLRFNDPDLQPLVDAGIIDAGDVDPDLHASSSHRALYSRWGHINTEEGFTHQAVVTSYGLQLEKPKDEAQWGESAWYSSEGIELSSELRDVDPDDALDGAYAIKILVDFQQNFSVTHGGTVRAKEFIGDGSQLTGTFTVGEGVKQVGNRIELDKEWLAQRIKEVVQKLVEN